MAICVLAAGLHVAGRVIRREPFPVGEVIILLLIPKAMLTAAIFAKLQFGQPIVFGLIEERRMLSFYAIFLIGLSLRWSATPFEDLLGALNWTATIYLALGVLLQTGILGDLAARDVPYLDPRKYRIISGMNVYSAAVAVGIALFVHTRSLAPLLPVLIGIIGLVAIGQTRSTALQLSAAMPLALAAITPIGPLVIAAFFAMTIPIALLSVPPLMRLTAGTGVGEVDVRLATIGTILRDLSQNDLFGMGSLSLMWNNGFHGIYNRFFYLSDVGAFGDLYRYGLLLPLFYGALIAALVAFARCAGDIRARHVLIFLAVLYSFGIVSQGLMSQSGSDWALFVSFAVAGSTSRRTLLNEGWRHDAPR